ncbi:MAG: PAS domain-containing protein [Oscillospiraceae bacterium]
MKRTERTLKEIEQQIVSSDFDYIEYRIKTKSGEIKWLYDVGHVVKDNEGVNWFYTIIVDITDLKKAQELVSFEKESFKFILPYIQDVIFEWCIKNNTLSCSENFKSKMGYSLPKSIEENGEFWVKTVSPDDIDNVRELISSLQNGTKFASCDVRLKNSDGEYVNFKLSSTSIIDNEGKTARIVGVLSEQH